MLCITATGAYFYHGVALSSNVYPSKLSFLVVICFWIIFLYSNTKSSSGMYSVNRHELLILHEETNIEVTRAIIQCLVPGAWLNDEVSDFSNQM